MQMGKRNKETANLFLSHLSTAMLLFAFSLSALTGYSLLLKLGQFGLPRRRHAVADCQGCINRKLEKDWSQVLNPGALRCVVGFLIYVSAAGPNIFPWSPLAQTIWYFLPDRMVVRPSLSVFSSPPLPLTGDPETPRQILALESQPSVLLLEVHDLARFGFIWMYQLDAKGMWGFLSAMCKPRGSRELFRATCLMCPFSHFYSYYSGALTKSSVSCQPWVPVIVFERCVCQ